MTTVTPRPATAAAAPSAIARLDRLNHATRSHKRWMLLLGFLFTFDLVDLNTFAYVAPQLRKEWGISIGHIGDITSVGFAGMFLGAVIGGRLADRFGRRRVLLSAVCFYSLFSLLTAAAQNPWQLAALRFLTGIGLQAMTGVLMVFVSEMFPRAHRGRFQSFILAIGFVGVPIAAIASRLVVPIGDGYWRIVFVIGSLGIFGAVVAFKMLPESIRWQSTHGQEEQALKMVEILEAEAIAEHGDELAPAVVLPAAVPAKLRDMLVGRNLKRLIATSLVSILLILCFYGFNSWIPTLLVAHGYTTTESLNVAVVLAFAAVPGALLAVPFIDKWDRRWMLLGIETVVAALLLAFGLIDNTASLLVTGFLATMLLQCGVAVLYTYIPEVFPTTQRGLGAGIAGGFGRLSGVIGGITVAAVYNHLGFSAVFVYLAAAALLMGLVLAVLGERTTNVELDQIGTDDKIEVTA